MCAYKKLRSIYYTSDCRSFIESLREANAFVSLEIDVFISLEKKSLDWESEEIKRSPKNILKRRKLRHKKTKQQLHNLPSKQQMDHNPNLKRELILNSNSNPSSN